MRVQHLTDAFSFLQNHSKKSKGTYIKDILSFHFYFEIDYSPCDIIQTIYDTNLSLKQKFIEKLTTLGIHPYVKDRYAFVLKCYFICFHDCQHVNLTWPFDHHTQIDSLVDLC